MHDLTTQGSSVETLNSTRPAPNGLATPSRVTVNPTESLFAQMSRLIPERSALAFRFEEYVLVDDASNDGPPLPPQRA